MAQYDVAVIGGGAAGLSAALVLSRALRKVVLVDAGAPRNAPATHMHGYLSRDGLPPGDLLNFGQNEVKSYGGEILSGTTTELVPDGRSGFWVLLEGGHRISARRLLVTTGLRDELPDIPGRSASSNHGRCRDQPVQAPLASPRLRRPGPQSSDITKLARIPRTCPRRNCAFASRAPGRLSARPAQDHPPVRTLGLRKRDQCPMRGNRSSPDA